MSDTPAPSAFAETLAARDQAIAALSARAEAAEARLSGLNEALSQARAGAEVAQSRAIAIEAEAEARLGPLTQMARRNLFEAVSADRALRRRALEARDRAALLVLEVRKGLSAELDRERKAGKDLARRLEQSEQERDALRAELTLLAARLEQAESKQAALSGDLDRERKACKELAGRLERTGQDRDAVRAALLREQSERRAVETRLTRVLSSTSWKLSAPVRWIGRALGRGA